MVCSQLRSLSGVRLMSARGVTASQRQRKRRVRGTGIDNLIRSGSLGLLPLDSYSEDLMLRNARFTLQPLG